MRGLLQRLHKLQSFIELQSELDSTNIIYPHKKQHSDKDGTGAEKISSVANVTNEEIEAAVKSGYDRARQAMEKLGMKRLLESKKSNGNLPLEMLEISVMTRMMMTMKMVKRVK